MDDGYTERDYAEQQQEAHVEEPPPTSGWETYDYDRVFDQTYATQPPAEEPSESHESNASYWDEAAEANELDVAALRAGTMVSDAVGSPGGEIGDMDPGPLFENMRLDQERAEIEAARETGELPPADLD